MALNATRGQSLGESLKAITGLYSIQTGPSISKPVIHGLYSNRIITLNNGIRQEDQQWGSEHAPQIDPFIASRLTVIKGAASIRYGSDAIGGVILVEPKDMPTQPGIGGEVNLVGATNGRMGVASAYLEGAFKKWSGFKLAATGYAQTVGGTCGHPTISWKTPAIRKPIFRVTYITTTATGAWKCTTVSSTPKLGCLRARRWAA